MSGFEVLERIRNNEALRDVPVVVFTGREMSPDEDAQLHALARSVVVKGVESPERLLDETALFLHRVVSDLPAEKQRMLDRLHRSDEDLFGRTVLVVDDDVRNIFALSSVLERRGMKVLTASTGKEAVKHARIHHRPGDRADGHHDAGNGRLRDDAGDPAEPVAAAPADRRVDGEGDEGRPGEVSGGRRVGLPRETGEHRATLVHVAHVASSLSGQPMAGTDKANILLVDDQPGKLLSYEAMLSGLGETLIPARSAREALNHLLNTDVAVVLIDVCMPELDGFELAAMMREHPRFQQTPIIFVSGVHLTEFDRLKGYACGAVDYVPVPVVPEILRAKVSVFVDLFRKTRELERLNRELEQRVAERTAELQAAAADLRDREEALREADRSKDEFLAVLAHEIRNPLAPIRTAVHLLRLKELSDAQRVKAREVIERQVEHLVRLIDDLLDVARITRGAITLQRERVDLAEVVARAIETSRPLIDARRHELVVALPEQPLTVDGDMTRLSQVIGNLLNNAAKYTDTGGRSAGARRSERATTPSSACRTTAWAFRRTCCRRCSICSRRRTAPSDRQSGGLGIGLALVRRLVDLHGGTRERAQRGDWATAPK